MRKLLIAAALLFVVPTLGQAKSLEELLAEKGIISKAEANSVSSSTNVPAKVFWNDGTRIEFPDNGFTTKINVGLKTAYTYTDRSDDRQDLSSFDVKDARFVFSGTALNNEFFYKLEERLTDQRILDGYLGWRPCRWSEIKLGQFKTTISRQFVNSSFKLMFADRSFASETFDFGYQKGARAEGKLMDEQIVFGGAIFNGNSDGEGEFATATDARNMLTADLRYNPIGKMDPYAEGDVDYTESPALSFGTAYAYSPQRNEVAEDVITSANVNRVSVDANLKYQGLGVNAEYYVSREDYKTLDTFTDQGAYLQAGYFVLPKNLELAGRWSIVKCDDGQGFGNCEGMDSVNQATAGINYYLWKHTLKAQLNYDHLNSKPVAGGTEKQNRWIFLVSSYF